MLFKIDLYMKASIILLPSLKGASLFPLSKIIGRFFENIPRAAFLISLIDWNFIYHKENFLITSNSWIKQNEYIRCGGTFQSN